MEISYPQKLTYDFKLFRPRPGEDPHVSVRNVLDGLPTGPPDPAKEALKRRVANEILAAVLQLRVCEFPFGHIARFEQMSEEAARRKYRHLELNGPDGGNGILVLLRDDDACVSVPFWHDSEKAVEVFRVVWSCLGVIQRVANYVCYDLQLGRAFEVSAGFEDTLARYEELVRKSREPLAVSQPEKQTDWVLARIRQLTVARDRDIVLVAEQESGAVSGFAEVTVEQTHANGEPSVMVARLKGWYVAPAFRGRGIGRRLRESAERWALGRGVTNLVSAHIS